MKMGLLQPGTTKIDNIRIVCAGSTIDGMSIKHIYYLLACD
jgi:hypothetical protein